MTWGASTASEGQSGGSAPMRSDSSGLHHASTLSACRGPAVHVRGRFEPGCLIPKQGAFPSLCTCLSGKLVPNIS